MDRKWSCTIYAIHSLGCLRNGFISRPIWINVWGYLFLSVGMLMERSTTMFPDCTASWIVPWNSYSALVTVSLKSKADWERLRLCMFIGSVTMIVRQGMKAEGGDICYSYETFSICTSFIYFFITFNGRGDYHYVCYHYQAIMRWNLLFGLGSCLTIGNHEFCWWNLWRLTNISIQSVIIITQKVNV